MIFSVRHAVQSDLENIVDIYNSTVFLRNVTADLEPVTVESKQKWFNEHNSNNRPLLIFEDADNQLIGWVSFQSFYGRPAYHNTAEISIYLHESKRHKGYGNKILEYCLNNVSQYQIKILLAFVFSNNVSSIKLFEKFGFKHWGILPDIAVIDGEEISLTILGRKIDY